MGSQYRSGSSNLQDYEAQAVPDGEDYTRTGTVWTATSHVITAVIGSGVLSLAWSVAQLGWLFGPIALLAFACVTYCTASFLSDCYRHPDSVTGKRNRTYMEVVRAILGPGKVKLCGIFQYSNLVGTMVGYTITSAKSMMAVKKTNCIHRYGRNADCRMTGNEFMVVFGILEMILSQLPNLEKITWLSILAAVMSFAYSSIGLGLCIAKLASNPVLKGNLLGGASSNIPLQTKIWSAFQALGNIAFAYTYAIILIEIQDTLRSPPAENKTMKRATLYGIGVTTGFYVSIGCIGYAAFGNNAPGNFLTGGFYEPFWLIDIANICVIVHLLGAYQVFAQPVFAVIEKCFIHKWPRSGFINKVYKIQIPCRQTPININLSKLVFRTVFVGLISLVAMILPFFNEIMGLIGAVVFWPLTVYFPVNLYIAHTGIKSGTFPWMRLQGLSILTLLVSLVAAIGSVAGIVNALKHATPFKTVF